MTCQLPVEHIDLDLVPLPRATRQLYLATLDVGKGGVRHRTIEFIVDSACFDAIAALRRKGELGTRFAMETTGERIGFIPMDQVRFDLASEPGVVTYSVAQVVRMAKLDI